MSQTIAVSLPGREYPIHIGQGILDQIGPGLAGIGRRGRVLVIANPVVARWYLDPVLSSLARSGFAPHQALVPDGEEHKSLFSALFLYEQAVAAGLDRADTVVSLGGGVIGDLAGFVAATYLRGLAFAQLPTTLLAQIDSSIGGKVAINLPVGKNLVGAFYQPCLVWTDTATLRTLPAREVRSGLIEMLKHGLLDAEYFAWFERNLDCLLSGDGDALAEGIAGSCRIKAAIVTADEREQGERALLNLGHTVGHAVETVAGYGVWRHGEAVGLGLIVAGRLARRLGSISAADLRRLEGMIEVILGDNLPRITEGQVEPIVQAMMRDKKVLRGALRFVLPEGLGRARIVTEVTPEMIGCELRELAGGFLTEPTK